MPKKPRAEPRAEPQPAPTPAAPPETAPPPVVVTNAYLRDFQRAARSGRRDMGKLARFLDLLRAGQEVPRKYQAHILKGAPYKGITDVHIEGDWILLYRFIIDDGERVLELCRLGTHSDLF